jgi:mRNA deadenylase 3'-5' endonuclease subunit Ccr4
LIASREDDEEEEKEGEESAKHEEAEEEEEAKKGSISFSGENRKLRKSKKQKNKFVYHR